MTRNTQVKRRVPNLSAAKKQNKRPSSPPSSKGEAKRVKTESTGAPTDKILALMVPPPAIDYMSFINPNALALYGDVEVAAQSFEADF